MPRASAAANSRASVVDAVSSPRRFTGSPTRNSSASYSSARATIRPMDAVVARHGLHRHGQHAVGVARATPTRALPTSMPRRTPRRKPLTRRPLQRVAHRARAPPAVPRHPHRRPARRRRVRRRRRRARPAAPLASAPAFAPAARAASLVATITTGRPLTDGAERDDRGVRAETVAHLSASARTSSAERRRRATRATTRSAPTRDGGLPRGRGPGPAAPAPRMRDPLLRGLEARREIGDAVGQLVARRLERGGELRDDRTLGRQLAERVQARRAPRCDGWRRRPRTRRRG